MPLAATGQAVACEQAPGYKTLACLRSFHIPRPHLCKMSGTTSSPDLTCLDGSVNGSAAFLRRVHRRPDRPYITKLRIIAGKGPALRREFGEHFPIPPADFNAWTAEQLAAYLARLATAIGTPELMAKFLACVRHRSSCGGRAPAPGRSGDDDTGAAGGSGSAAPSPSREEAEVETVGVVEAARRCKRLRADHAQADARVSQLEEDARATEARLARLQALLPQARATAAAAAAAAEAANTQLDAQVAQMEAQSAAVEQA